MSATLHTTGVAELTEDRTLSPYTGWTREHWAQLADRMLLAVRPYGSSGHSLITLPGRPGGYGTAVDGLEGFARSFMLAGFRLAGENGDDPLGLAEWYAEGLAQGTDPSSPTRWVRPNEHGQAKVEAAAIALTLHLTRPWIWDRLTDTVQQHVIAYLAEMINTDYPPINWVWFQLVVEEFLRSVGGPYDPADFERGLALHDTFVRANGWYSDGAERAFDHYAGWALHLYPMLWLKMAAGQPAADARREQYTAHLDRYLTDAVSLVGADGSPLIQGRSLIYRFAAAAPFWAGALAGTTALSPGEIRRAASGIVRHFVDHGAPDDRGLLSTGWHHEWPQLAQSYSGTGSPYWASKGMLGLALPADHPVWTATEEPLPIEAGDTLKRMMAPGWLVSGTRADGIVRVVNHGTDHANPGVLITDSPLYARLGYSTATSPVLSQDGWADPADQAVVLLDESGRPSHRTGFETLSPAQVGHADAPDALDVPDAPDFPDAIYAFSRSRAHWGAPSPDSPSHGSGRHGDTRIGAFILTGSVVRGPWEVRLIRVDDAPGSDVPIGPLRVAGWPVTVEHGATGDVRAGVAVAGNGRLTSTLANIVGPFVASVTISSDATPLGDSTATPWLSTRGVAETGRWYAALLTLTGNGETPGDFAVTVDIDIDGASSTVSIIWPKGISTVVALPEVALS